MIYWVSRYFSRPRNHFAALYEVSVIAIFSLAPIAIAIFAKTAPIKSDSSEFSDNFIENFLYDLLGKGQLYLLAYGIFGTVVWLAFLKSDKPRHGARSFLGLLALIVMLPVIGYQGVDPTFSTVMNKSVITWSYYFYAALLTIYYLLLFYMDIEPPQPSEIFDREARDMRRSYEELDRNGK